MKPVTLLIPRDSVSVCRDTLAALADSGLVEEIMILGRDGANPDIPKSKNIITDHGPSSGQTLDRCLSGVKSKYLFLISRPVMISLSAQRLENMLDAAESTKAGIVYADFFEEDEEGGKTLHPLNDYKPGSVRDDFDFGPVMLFSLAAVRDALQKHGAIADVSFAGLYDLRLKVSIDHPLHHIPMPLYSVNKAGNRGPGVESLFSYVDPCNALAQKEMESVFTGYLKKIGAFLSPDRLKKVDSAGRRRPVVASVIIPVRNRKGTVADAVRSALSQQTDFTFNVIVVDNHSTDGTTALLDDLSTTCGPRMEHIVPGRTDLAIGGCWNEGLHSPACGRFAVQLDSDDLYGSPRSLQSIVDLLRAENYAMVVGSYTLVNERIEEIPPGLIDHREWTDENGHNNALRINGLGAPRAFDATLIRKIDFPNVSYGEDYAVALRICREYRIGRIFESLYLCRRWAGNTDASLSIEATNENDAFKDSVRTEEIRARQEINRQRER